MYLTFTFYILVSSVLYLCSLVIFYVLKHDHWTIVLGKAGCHGVAPGNSVLDESIYLYTFGLSQFIPSDHTVEFLDPSTLAFLYSRNQCLLSLVLVPTTAPPWTRHVAAILPRDRDFFAFLNR